MAKAVAKTPKTMRSRKSELMGYTVEGLPIWRPHFKLKSFTEAQLRRVVDEVKRKQALAATDNQMAD